MVHPLPLRAPTWKSPPFITCLNFPAGVRFLRFSWHFRFCFFVFFCFCFRFVCVCVLGTRSRGRAHPCCGCQRVLAGRGEVERSAVASFVPRRRVCLETRDKHEWALFGLHLHDYIESVRVYMSISRLQGNRQVVLIFAIALEIT